MQVSRILQLKCATYGYGDLHLTRSLIISLVTQYWLETSLGLPGWSSVNVVGVVVAAAVAVVATSWCSV